MLGGYNDDIEVETVIGCVHGEVDEFGNGHRQGACFDAIWSSSAPIYAKALDHARSYRFRDQLRPNVQVGYRVGYLCTKPRSPATALKTKEYIGVIDLYGGGDWERFSTLPSILTLPHRHARGVALMHGSSPYSFDPMYQPR